MVFVEADLPGVEFADAALHGLELGLGLLGARGGVVDRGAQPGDRLVDGLDAGTHRVDLPGQSGQALTTVGLGAGRGQVRPFRFSRDLLTFGELGARRVETFAGFRQFLEQLAFAFGDFVGLGLQLVGVGTAGGLGFGIQMLGALTGDPDGRADPLGQRREPKPALLGGVGALAEVTDGTLVRIELGGGRLQPCAELVMLAAQRRLGLIGVVELRPAGDQVIGGQPQPRVAQVGLDGLGAPRHLGLPTQRFELASQLGGQIGEAGQVGLHRVELAHRLFLAFAVFEHSGGLLDEGAPVLGTRLEDLRELALTDDDVHFAPDTRVGQQLLHIHQTATAAVDLVFTGTVTEHPAGDRDLGVVDRQRVVGVVDRQRDLGPPQRGSRGGPGEDDVLHLAAAQGLGALFTHHPGQRVDDVGLAGPVGTDDAGDAGFEAQSRRRGEGLEALQRQTLQMHDVPPYRRGGQRSVKPVNASAGSDQFAITLSTSPGVSPPSRAPSSCSQASFEPCATTWTRPSGLFAANPVRPSSRAFERVHQRKPTPCTYPCTQAVSRTSLSPNIFHLKIHFGASL